MNLVFRYLGTAIESIPIEELRRILQGISADPKVKMASNGMIMLTNGQLVKCVSAYYMTPEGKRAGNKKMSNACFYVQKDLDITGISNNDCRACHLKCMDMLSDKNLVRLS